MFTVSSLVAQYGMHSTVTDCTLLCLFWKNWAGPPARQRLLVPGLLVPFINQHDGAIITSVAYAAAHGLVQSPASPAGHRY